MRGRGARDARDPAHEAIEHAETRHAIAAARGDPVVRFRAAGTSDTSAEEVPGQTAKRDVERPAAQLGDDGIAPRHDLVVEAEVRQGGRSIGHRLYDRDFGRHDRTVIPATRKREAGGDRDDGETAPQVETVLHSQYSSGLCLLEPLPPEWRE